MSWTELTKQSKTNVREVLDSGWISRKKYIPLFEKKFSNLHGGKYGIFVNSGTDALRISLLTLKEIYRWQNGDEVIIPGLTFVATANAVLQSGLRPVFVDVQKETGNIEPNRIVSQLTRSTRAIVAVHLFGLPASMPAVMQMANTHRLRVIEDSCETVGVHRLNGDVACFSFYMSHHLQAGIGGMIVTNTPKIENVARSLMNHGRIDDGTHFRFGRIGYSSRATEMEAALGCGAIENLDKDLAKRRNLASQYSRFLIVDFDNVIGKPPFSPNHSWMFYPILLKKGNREELLKFLRRHKIESREAMPIINQPCYAGMYKKGSCPNAENWTRNGLLLPLHPLMTAKQVFYVCMMIKRFYENLG